MVTTFHSITANNYSGIVDTNHNNVIDDAMENSISNLQHNNINRTGSNISTRSSTNSVGGNSTTTSSSSRDNRKKKKKDKKKETQQQPINTKFTLTNEERIWAETLRTAIERERPPIGPISDYEIVQHAIIAKNKTEKALKRIKRLQQFKKQYNIRPDTNVYEALTIIHHFLDIHPNFLSSFGQNVLNGQYIIAFHLGEILKTKVTNNTTNNNSPSSNSNTAVDASFAIAYNKNIGMNNTVNNTKTPTTPTTTSSAPINYQDIFQALYYIFHALQPDLDAIRNGTIWISNFETVQRNIFTFNLLRGTRALCRDSYPIRIKDLSIVNPPIFIRAIYNLCKPFMSPKAHQIMHIENNLHYFIQKTLYNPSTISGSISTTTTTTTDHDDNNNNNNNITKKHQIPKNILSPLLGGVQRPIDLIEELEDALKRRFDSNESFRF